MHPALSNNQENLVLQFVRQFDGTQLQATHPSGHLHLLHGVEHVAELIHLLGCVFMRTHASVGIQLFVVVVLYLLAHGSQQALLLARLMLTATFHILYLLDVGKLVQLASLNLFTYRAIAQGS